MKNSSPVGALSVLASLLCTDPLQGQLTVYEERHHTVLFENEFVRLIDLQIPPGNKTLVHTHNQASVVVFLTASRLVIQNTGSDPVVTDVRPGVTVYRNYDEKPVEHVVWCEDPGLFRCLVVELPRQPGPQAGCPDLSSGGFHLLWKEKKVSAFSLNVEQGRQYLIPFSGCPYFLVNYSGASKIIEDGHPHIMLPGEFAFVAAKSRVCIEGEENGGCIVLELH